MLAQSFRTKQSDNRRRGLQQTVMNEPFQVNDAYVYADNVDMAERKTPDLRDQYATLFQIHGRGADLGGARGDAHLADECVMQKGRECAGVDHQARRSAIDRAIDIQIEILT